MAIDRERAEQFNLDIRAITQGLSPDLAYDTFKNRLLDVIARGDIEAESVREYMNIIRPVFEKEMLPFFERTEQSYNQTVDLVNHHYNDIGVDIHRDLDKIQAIEQVNRTEIGDYKEGAVRTIAQQVRKSAIDGESIEQLSKRLLKRGDDKVKSYAEVLAHTQLSGYGQALKNEKALLGNVVYFEYYGIVRSVTRIFCRELAGQSEPVFHIDDIRKFKNGHRLPVFEYKGGYRCFHHWEPDVIGPEKYSVVFYTKPGEGKVTLELARSKTSKTQKTPDRKKPDVGNFKRKSEATKYLKEEYNIDSDFGSINLDVINPAVAELDRLAKDYPSVAERLEYFGKPQRYIPKKAYAAASIDGREIILSQTYMRRKADTEKLLKREKDSGWGVTDTIEGVIAHEFGHQVDNWLRTTSYSQKQGKWKSDKYGETTRSDLSIYGMSQPSEMWAEGFSEYRTSKTPRKFALDLGNHLESIMENF